MKYEPFKFMLDTQNPGRTYRRTRELREGMESKPKTSLTFSVTDFFERDEMIMKEHEVLQKIYGSWRTSHLWTNTLNGDPEDFESMADLDSREDRLGWMFLMGSHGVPMKRSVKRTGASITAIKKIVYRYAPFTYNDLKKVARRRWANTWKVAKQQGVTTKTIATVHGVTERTVIDRINDMSEDFSSMSYLSRTALGVPDDQDDIKYEVLQVLNEAKRDLSVSEIYERGSFSVTKRPVQGRVWELAEDGDIRRTRSISNIPLYELNE